MRRCAATVVIVAGLVGLPGLDAAAAARPCPTFTPARVRGTVSDPALDELSGLAAGRANTGVLWAHADSGTGPRLQALSSSGAVLATYVLDGATAVDWEDLAIGPGPEPDQAYLYVGDIGDNPATRPNVTVYRVREPVIEDPPGPDPVVLTGVDALTVEYPDGARDAEALLVDPRTGDLLIVTKTLTTGPSGVYRYPAPQQVGAPVTLEHVASLAVPSSPLSGSTVTAGDISPGGDEILLRTYFSAYVWRRGPGQSVAGALAGGRCPVPLQFETQGEAIAYRRDGNAYFTASEWNTAGPRPLHEYRARWRPDGLIRLGSGPFAGDDVVNLTGAGQTRVATIGPRGRASFTVRVANDGDRVDRIRVRGDGGGPRFNVRYRRGGVDVTSAVTAGTYEVTGLVPGTGVPVVVEVTARPGTPPGSSLTVATTLTSTTSPANRDRVRATTRLVR